MTARSRPLLTAVAMLAAAGLAVVTGCVGAHRTAPAAAPVVAAGSPTAPRNDYGNPDAWLCRPGRQDACTVDLTATAITAGGDLVREAWNGDPGARIDCFYVYPTVSLDPAPYSDMQPGPEERRAVELQLARFGSKCRLFAPMYRQLTMAGLREALRSGRPPDWSVPYADVLDAWNHYLQHDNLGRGVVLIGHSQGSRHLIRLLREEIEGKPVQGRIVSALILGANFTPPPPGSDPARQLPLCGSATQTGCVISYVSFRSSSPPPANARFGRGPGGATVACTNPAALGGGRGELQAYLSTRGTLMGSSQPFPWLKGRPPVDTPFVRLPGLLTGECVSVDGASYLSVSLHGEAGGPRTVDIPGDLIVNGTVLTDWGLHLVDANLAMGNLVDIVGQQARAYLDGR
jgi:hypothetical protein